MVAKYRQEWLTLILIKQLRSISSTGGGAGQVVELTNTEKLRLPLAQF